MLDIYDWRLKSWLKCKNVLLEWLMRLEQRRLALEGSPEELLRTKMHLLQQLVHTHTHTYLIMVVYSIDRYKTINIQTQSRNRPQRYEDRVGVPGSSRRRFLANEITELKVVKIDLQIQWTKMHSLIIPGRGFKESCLGNGCILWTWCFSTQAGGPRLYN